MANIDAQIEIIRNSSFLDSSWYLNQYADYLIEGMDAAEHYTRIGVALGLHPGPQFDSLYYLQTHKDVNDSRVNPLYHYLSNGMSEGRKIRPVSDAGMLGRISRFKQPLSEAVIKKIMAGTRKIIRDSGAVDSSWYGRTYSPESEEPDAILHYVRFGARVRHNPSPWFDTDWYYREHPEILKLGVNPLAHYLEIGAWDNSDPCAYFDTDWYLQTYRDIIPTGMNPLTHYLARPDRAMAQTSPRFDLSWLAQSAAFDLQKHPDALYLLKDEADQNLDPVTRKTLQSRGLIRPATLSQFMDDGVPFAFENIGDSLKAEIEARAKADSPLVSIIMPTWNRRGVIGRAIDSVLAQTWTSYELIIVDDGSEDDTVAWLKSTYAQAIKEKRIVLALQPNTGVCAARNTGLALAKGSIITYLDSDNAWRPDALKVFLAAFNARPDAGSVYCAALVHDNIQDRRHIVGRPYDRRSLMASNFIDLNAFAHRHSVLKRHGGFNTGLRRMVDWELILRYSANDPIVYMPVVVVDYFIDAGLNNITMTQPLTENVEKVYRLHRYEYYRNGQLSANKLLQAYIGDDFTDPDVIKIYADAEKLRPPIETLRMAIVIDEDIAATFDEKDMRRRYPWVAGFYLHNEGVFTPLETPEAAGRRLSELTENVFYWPTSKAAMLRPMSLMNVALAIGLGNLDLAVVSNYGHDKASAQKVAVKYLRDHVVVSRPVAATWFNAQALPDVVYGRILRLEVSRLGKNPPLVGLNSLLNGDFSFDKERQNFWTQGSNAPHAPSIRFDPATLPVMAAQLPEDKPHVVLLGMKTSVGGVERLTLNLARAWQKSHYCVYLALEPSRVEEGDLSHEIEAIAPVLINGAEIVSPGSRNLLLEYVNRAYAPRNLFIMNGSMWLAHNAEIVRNAFPATGIVDQQVYDHIEGWIGHYHKPSIRSFDTFVAVNTKIESAFLLKQKIDARQVVMIPHGLDTERALNTLKTLTPEDARKTYNIGPDQRLVLFAGRLTAQKRPLDFIELAAKRQKYTKEYYILIGDGVMRQACLDRIKALGLKNIRHIPFIEDLSRIYRAADALVVTSDYEGLPLVLVEAVCMGLPVVSTDVGEIRSVVDRFQAGLADLKPGDLAGLERNLIKVLLDEGKTYGDRKAEASDYFSLKTMGKRYAKAGDMALRNRQAATGLTPLAAPTKPKRPAVRSTTSAGNSEVEPVQKSAKKKPNATLSPKATKKPAGN